MANDSSLLSDLGSFYESIPFEYLLIGHCLLVASWFPKLKDRFLLSYWVRQLLLRTHSICPGNDMRNPQSVAC